MIPRNRDHTNDERFIGLGSNMTRKYSATASVAIFATLIAHAAWAQSEGPKTSPPPSAVAEIASLLEGVASILWPCLAAALLFRFRREITQAAEALVDRVKAGAKVSVGILEFGGLDRVASSGQPVPEREVGRVTVRNDPQRQKQIIAEQKRSHYAFLVHYAYPLNERRNEYDIILYFVGHFNQLEHVDRVEYFLGVGWGDAVFTCRDRVKGFAIKVAAVGSFLAMASVHLTDGQVVTQSRFIELEPIC
jgi:hypothetical protein